MRQILGVLLPFDKHKEQGEGSRQGCSKLAAKLLGMRKFSGFLPKAATTLERPWDHGTPANDFIQPRSARRGAQSARFFAAPSGLHAGLGWWVTAAGVVSRRKASGLAGAAEVGLILGAL